ncbi:MAG TPA: endo-1,4-beta-xylanase [Steroidobacteraceae bacterium]
MSKQGSVDFHARRRCLTCGVAGALLAPAALGASLHTMRTLAADAGDSHASRPPDSLEGLARVKGLHFGSAVGGAATDHPSFADARVRALLRTQCGIMTPENELKWIALRPAANRFDFRGGDALARFAADNGLLFRGHTLLWNRPERFPAWLRDYAFGAQPGAEAERLLRTHIATVCAHFREVVFAWDVINETIDPDTGGLRRSVFTERLGPRLIDIAFQAARTAAPGARLVYNDYMSWNRDSARHRDGVLDMLRQARARGVPIDALGVQSHLDAGKDGAASGPAVQQREWRSFLDDVTALGLDLVITELDVNDGTLPADITTRDASVAAQALAYLELMLSYPQLKYVVAWGLVDEYSWLQQRSPRADGLPKRPCPYNDRYQPTPLRQAIATAFRGASGRTPAALPAASPGGASVPSLLGG